MQTWVSIVIHGYETWRKVQLWLMQFIIVVLIYCLCMHMVRQWYLFCLIEAVEQFLYIIFIDWHDLYHYNCSSSSCKSSLWWTLMKHDNIYMSKNHNILSTWQICLSHSTYMFAKVGISSSYAAEVGRSFQAFVEHPSHLWHSLYSEMTFGG